MICSSSRLKTMMKTYRIFLNFFLTLYFIRADLISDSQTDSPTKFHEKQITLLEEKKSEEGKGKALATTATLSLRRKAQVTHKCGQPCSSNPQCQGGDRACEWCGKSFHWLLLLLNPVERKNLCIFFFFFHQS